MSATIGPYASPSATTGPYAPLAAGAHFERAARTDGLFEEDPANREEQPCWCPDAYRDYALHINYCPRHGQHPDPELWDYSAGPMPESR